MNDFVVKQGIQLGGSVKGNTGTVTGNATLDLSTGDAFEVTPTADVTFAFSNPPAAGNAQSFSVALNGANVSTSYDLANAVYDSVSFNASGQDSNTLAMTVSADGAKMFIAGNNSDSVYQYTLSTAFDLSTASYDSVSFSVASQEATPTGIEFNPSGTEMYVVGFSGGGNVFQYNLTTAFDISTASYSGTSFSVLAQDQYPFEIAFNPDGTKMYIIGLTTVPIIYQYTLSSAFNITTASYDGVTFNMAAQNNNISGLDFNSAGTKMFGVGGSDVFQYSLSTPFDVGTASYDGVSFSTISQESFVRGLVFSSTGNKLLILGNSGRIYQYSTGTAPAPATITYPASVAWSGGTAPASPADGETDLLTFYTEDGGNTYYGFKVGDALA